MPESSAASSKARASKKSGAKSRASLPKISCKSGAASINFWLAASDALLLFLDGTNWLVAENESSLFAATSSCKRAQKASSVCKRASALLARTIK